jgi:hypothetical protein
VIIPERKDELVELELVKAAIPVPDRDLVNSSTEKYAGSAAIEGFNVRCIDAVNSVHQRGSATTA